MVDLYKIASSMSQYGSQTKGVSKFHTLSTFIGRPHFGPYLDNYETDSLLGNFIQSMLVDL